MEDREEGTTKRDQKNIAESEQLYDILSEMPKGKDPEENE